MRKIVLLLAALALAGCGEDEPALIDVKGSHGKPDAAAIWGAIVAFQQACPDLSGKYWGDVESATAEVAPAMPYRVDAHGWRSELRIEIRIARSPKDIPKGFRAGGEVLFYQLGGGRSPGINASKDIAQRLCPMPVNADADTHKPWPAMAVMDDLG